MTTRVPGHLIRLVRHHMGAGAVKGSEADAHADLLRIERKDLIPTLTFLRNDPDADLSLLVDLFAVDVTSSSAAPVVAGTRPRAPSTGRFSLHVVLRSPWLPYRAHVIVALSDEDPSFPSLVSLYGNADWLEREAFEMHGVFPDGGGHPRPLLLYAGFAGHPGRRDYRAKKTQPLVPLIRHRAPTVVRDVDPPTGAP